jgi:hypothetical protein
MAAPATLSTAARLQQVSIHGWTASPACSLPLLDILTYLIDYALQQPAQASFSGRPSSSSRRRRSASAAMAAAGVSDPPAGA